LSRDLKVGKATIERWYHQRYWHEFKRMHTTSLPRALGIDEHFFSKKEGYATTFCNLEKNKIFDVVKGRSLKDLECYLKSLPNKERVKVICIDLSSNYRNIIRKYFPQAKIVADRFHVIRLINHMCMQTYSSIDPNIRYQRGTLAALKTKPENLSHKRMQKRDEYLASNTAIKHIYHFKQRLHRLLTKRHRTAKQCERLLPIFTEMVKRLKQTEFKHLSTLGRTLHEWREEIVRMWRFTKNNGITEGFHRKMKLIQRRAYGFRNFENYRLRVKVLCG
jgi:transposase